MRSARCVQARQAGRSVLMRPGLPWLPCQGGAACSCCRAGACLLARRRGSGQTIRQAPGRNCASDGGHRLGAYGKGGRCSTACIATACSLADPQQDGGWAAGAVMWRRLSGKEHAKATQEGSARWHLQRRRFCSCIGAVTVGWQCQTSRLAYAAVPQQQYCISYRAAGWSCFVLMAQGWLAG